MLLACAFSVVTVLSQEQAMHMARNEAAGPQSHSPVGSPGAEDGMSGLQRARLAISRLNQGLESDSSDIHSRLQSS